MAVTVPMGVLGWVSDVDDTQLKTKVAAARQMLRELGDEASKNSRVQELFRDIATEADKASKSFRPVIDDSRSLSKEMRDLGSAVQRGLMPIGDAAKRLRELETSIGAQLKTLPQTSRAHTELAQVMQKVSAEATQLERANKGLSGSYSTSEVGRYAAALKDIEAKQKGNLISGRDALTQLKSLQGGMAQYAGSLEKGSAELNDLTKVMIAAGTAAGKLKGEQDKLEASFRTDTLRNYSGELKLIDANVRNLGFDRAAQQVEIVTRSLKEQQQTLATNGREYEQLGRVLQQAAAQQERYQKAAQDAARANDVSEIRSYAGELTKLEAELQDITTAFGRLDAQQRALKYDSPGIAQYRAESEKLGASFDGVGRGLESLLGRLREQSAALQAAGRDYSTVERLITQVEGATTKLGQAQDKTAQSFRNTELSRFTAELKDIEAAQKANAITAEQAAERIAKLQVEFKNYAASLGVAEHELGSLAGTQRDVTTGAGQLATAQERALKAFDSRALRDFAGELQTLVREQRDGGAAFDDTARRITELQGRLREYGATLEKGSQEQAALNRVLALSDDALNALGQAAERAAKGLDPDPLRKYAAEVYGVEQAEHDLVQAATLLEQAQKGTNDAFRATELNSYRADFERLATTIHSGSGDFDVIARDLETLQGKLRDYGATLEKGSQEQADLNRILELSDRALAAVGTSAERAQRGFEGSQVRDFASELDRVGQATDGLAGDLNDIDGELSQLSGELRDTGQVAETAGRSLTGLGSAAQQASRSFDPDPAHRYATEIYGLEQAQRDLAKATEILAGAQKQTQDSFKSAQLAEYRADFERLSASITDGSRSFDQIAGDLEALQGKLRTYASSLQEGSREHADLNRVLEATTRVLGLVGTEAQRATAEFDSPNIRNFKDDLNGVDTELDQLGGSLKDTSQNANLTARELATLADVNQKLEAATLRATAAQEKETSSFHSENIRQQVAALNDLKLALERGEITQTQFSESARAIGVALDQARAGLETNTRSYANYTGALQKVESSLAQAEGRVRTFGVSSGVAAGIGDQLQNILYSLGPVGESVGVAMGTASAGMAGAATSAKLLNIALAAGLVGALVGAAVAVGSIVKASFALDTGLTDVAKTTGFTRTELNQLGGELQNIALATGTPVKNLLDLASVAGSLGITGVKNVAAFTDVMNKLGVATDIVGEAGAKQLASFVNVTKQAGQTVGEAAEVVGNVITRLGNSLATTEQPILSMAAKIGGLATTADLSQADILALAGGFSALGFTAEAAGTSVQQIVNRIYQAGQVGGPALESFAKGARMTTEEFQALAKEDPAAAFQAYIKGLNDSKAAGENVVPVIKEITKDNETMLGVITRAVGGVDTLSLAFNVARDEAEKMTAMNNELQTRLESLGGIASMLGQAFRFAFDSLALAAIPALKGALTGVLDFTRALLGLEQTGSRTVSFATQLGQGFVSFGNTLVGVGERLDSVQQGFEDAGAKSREFVGSIFGVQTEAQRTAEALEQTGAATYLTGDGLRGLKADSDTAKAGLQSLSDATGRAGLLAAVDTLTSTLTGPSKQAFVTLANQAIASGGDIEEVAQRIQKAYNDTRIAMLETQMQALVDEQTAAIEHQADVYELAGQQRINSIREQMAQEQNLLAQLLERQRTVGDVSDEEVAGVRATIVALREQEASAVQTYDTFERQMYEANNRVNAATDAVNALTREIRTLGEEGGAGKQAENLKATETAANDTRPALEALAKAQSAYGDIENASLESQKNYLASLRTLKETYPGLASALNPLITRVRDLIKAQEEGNRSNDAAANSLEGLRAKRQDLVDQYNRAEIGSAAQADALAAIRAIDTQIAANDGLSKSATSTAQTVQLAYQGITAAFNAGALSGIQASQALEDKLAELKKQREDALLAGKYGTEDFNAIESEIQATNDALYTLNTALDTTVGAAINIFDPVAQGVRVFYDELGPLRAEILALDGTLKTASSSTLGFGSETEAAAKAQQTWGAAVLESRQHITDYDEGQRTLNKTIADGLTVLHQQDAVLAQLGVAIATDKTNQLAAAQAALTMATRESGDALLFAKDANRQAGEQSALTAQQTALVTTTQLEVNAALQQAENAYRITGDASQLNADKTAIYQTALETLYRAGIDPVSVGLGSYVTGLKESADATKTAEEGAKTYQDNLKSVIDVQKAFNDGISANEIDGYIESLRQAALGTGTLGQTARDLIKDLEGLKQTYQGLDAISSVFSNIAATFDTTGAQNQLDALNKKKEELLQSGDYDGADFAKLQDDIDNLESSIANTQLLQGLFQGVADGAAAAGDALEQGLGKGEQAIAGLSAGLTALGGAISETDSLMGTFLQNAGGALQSLVSGNFIGFVGGVLNTIVGIFKSHSDEVAQYETIVREHGEAVAKQFSEMTANGIQVDEKAYEEWKHNEEVRAEQHKKFLEEWVAREKKRNEDIAAANRELAQLSKDARDSLNELNSGVDDARIKFYESTHSGKEADRNTFIAQTILDFRAQSVEFNQEMGRITADKNAYIKQYLEANPGAGPAEANAAAEKIFGPQREALKEQFALTSATILNDGAKQAKDLGLSQSQFYEAVFAGNNEILGNMTEGQRQAIIQFVTVAHEMGIELPKALEDAYNNVDSANQRGAEQQNKQAELAQAQVDRLKAQYQAEQDTFKEESNKLQVQIAESKGAEREEYQKQLALLTEEHAKANAAYEGKIREANANLAKAEEEGAGDLANANQTKIDALKNADVEYARAYEERAATLKRLIESSTGEQKAIYEDQLRIETQAYEEASRKRNDEIQRLTEDGTQVSVAELQKQRDNLKAEYEKNQAEISKALETATGAERDALLKRQAALHDAYISSDLALVDTINESQDGVGSAIADQAQATVSMIEEDIATLNTAWAKRSSELQGFINTSTGATKAAYEEQYRQESAAYEQTRQDLQNQLVSANQGLLDAQDKSSSDFVAAQEEIGRKESEALGGIYEQLRALLGPDADLIISMIQNTYDKRRAAYLSSGQASADAAAQANQGELDTLAGIFEQLRALLGPDADVIISLIQNTYDKRTAAYQSGGEGSANAAQAAADSEAQSVANVNQILRNLFGPEAEGIIAQIHALNAKKQAEYKAGGEGNSQAAKLAAESEAQSVANINQLLRDLFGPDAEGIIAQIHALNAKKQEEYKSGGEQNAGAATEGANAETDAVNQGTDETTAAIDDNATQTSGALADRSATIESFLARGDVTPQLRTSLEAFNAAIADGGNLSAQEIDAARDKVTTALNDRGEKIRALVAEGVPLADAIRQVDTEFARTVDETSAGISRSASEGGQLAAQGIGQGQDAQLKAIEALKSGLLTGIGGLSGQVTPKISEEHRALMEAFIAGAKTSGGGIDAAEAAQIAAMQSYQAQLDSSVSGFGGKVAPVISSAHALIGGAFTQGGAEAARAAISSLGAVTTGVNAYQGLSPLASSVLGNVSSTVITQGTNLARSFTTQGSASEAAARAALGGVSGTFQSEGGKLSSTVQSVFNSLTGTQNSGASGFTSTLNSTFGNLNRTINSGYTLTAQGYQQGGTRSAAAIQAAYNAEETKFRSESAALEAQIAKSKGAERAKLQTEYDKLKGEHDAKSRAYQAAIADASRKEQSELSASERAIASALSALSSQGTRSTDSAFGALTTSWNRESGKYVAAVGGIKTDMQRALDAVASIIKNFKFPAFPAIPKVPTVPGISGSVHKVSASGYLPPTARAYAAGEVPVPATPAAAYAAPPALTYDLSYLYAPQPEQPGRNDASLKFSVDLTRQFQGPATLMGRAADLMWQTAKYERETAVMNRETAELWTRPSGRPSTFKNARRPTKRGP